jgi:hypothetical protein
MLLEEFHLCRFISQRCPIRDKLLPCSPSLVRHFPLDDLSIGKRDAGMTTTWTSKLRCSPLVQGCPVSFSQSFSNGGCMNISHGLYNPAHPVTHCVWHSQRSAPHLKKLGAKMADAPD